MLFCILNMQTGDSADASQMRDKNIISSFEEATEFAEQLENKTAANDEGECTAEEVSESGTEVTEESTEEISEATNDNENTEEALEDSDEEKESTENAADEDSDVEDEEAPDIGTDAATESVGTTIATDIGSIGIDNIPITGTEQTVGYILIGDSRFICMNRVVNVESDKNRFIIAKSGAGYDFLITTALPKAAAIERLHPEIDTWKYIINLGVNDLQSALRYAQKYRELAKTKHLVIESVNPVNADASLQAKQAKIEEFNKKMKSIEGVEYLDTYELLVRNGYATIDGLHYTDETSSYIYRCIDSYIKKDSGR